MFKKALLFFVAGIIFSSYSSAEIYKPLIGVDLFGYSAVAGAAINIGAGSRVTDNLGAGAAIGVAANAHTESIHSGAAVVLGANSSSHNIYAAHGAGVGAGGEAGNIYGGAAVVVGGNANVADVYATTAVSLGALSTSNDVYSGSTISGLGSNSINQNFITSDIIDTYKETFNINRALNQIDNAQSVLYKLENDYELNTTMASNNFSPGIYGGSALTIAASSTITFDGKGAENPLWVFNLSAALSVGALNNFEIINSGASASVIWNVGGAIGLGAGTSFIGTSFAKGAIVGDTAELRCGNLFSKAAIGIGSIHSTNCIGSNTWAGSASGLTAGVAINDRLLDGINILNNVRTNADISVPSTGTITLLLLLLTGLFIKYKK